ncbi:type I-E CRISPR-associated protein Cse1/CasA [Actinacidiphila oryziradicis]|uniref:Type I-E CRISPR-associated protein Cse1/CasA n=1 Tax=Actinacidiphila oryziradicis TaxID=2571141 RepID=A0A4U0RVR0_9ACTN|nr:type I-E CRISPR-associated protein Cse1/CasA [Actinacidiphila oryziradicis]
MTEQPCIPVRVHGRHEALSLREVLLRAHEIEDLAVPVPPAQSGLLRVLAAIAARLTGLDDPELSARQWTARRRALLQEPAGFDPLRVEDYLSRYVWDLFDTVRPWWQDPALTAQCTKRAGANKVAFGRPSGHNLAWLSAHRDSAPVPLPCDEALWHLVAQHYYGAASRCSTRTVGELSSADGTAGPLRSTVSFHPLAATLYESLLAGLPKYLGDGQDTPDRCPWEQDAPPDPLRPAEPVTWLGGLLTGRSRHALLLVPTPDGSAVADAYLTWGTQHPRLEATDPYLVIHTDTSKDAEQRRSPRQADADRAVWRELDALLLAGDESPTVQRPQVFDTLNDLPEPLRSTLRVWVCGFDQDGKTRNRTWYTALTPPVWTWAQDNDPAAARRMASCRQEAEQVAALLTKVAGQAWRQTTSPSGRIRGGSAWARTARAHYWPRAQTTFWRLQDDREAEARPAFVRDAVAALRQATAPTLRQHRRAGPALARAVAALHTDPNRTTSRSSGRKAPRA